MANITLFAQAIGRLPKESISVSRCQSNCWIHLPSRWPCRSTNGHITQQGKGAVKMHTLLDYDSLLPEFVNITEGKCGDNRGALDIPVPPHSVVVADRGYCDFSLLDYWDSRNVFLMSGTGTTCFTHKLKNVYCPKRGRKMYSSTRLLSWQVSRQRKNTPDRSDA